MPAEERVDPRTRCLKLLARREYSAAELRRKLNAQGCDAATAAAVVAELRQDGCQSDMRFAESFVRHRIEQGYGPLRIGFELAQRGVVDVDMERLARAAGGWPAIAGRAYHKRFGPGRPVNRAEQAKCSRYLAQRGFSWEQIRVALELASDGAETDLDDSI